MNHRLLKLMLLCLLMNAIQPVPTRCATADGARLPSQIFHNVEIMRRTDFSSNPYSQYIDVEDDVKQYIKMELGRIEESGAVHRGDELYYLGYLYSEIGSKDMTVRLLKRFLDRPEDVKDESLVISGIRLLAENLIRQGELVDASKYVSVLESRKAPLLNILFFELAKGFASQGKKKKCLLYGRKAIDETDSELIALFLDPLLAHLIFVNMIDGAVELVEETKSEDPRILEFLLKRKSFLTNLRAPLPTIPCKDLLWIDTPPTIENIPGRDRVLILYFWATWSDPSKVFSAALNGLLDEYTDKGLTVIGVTRGSTEASHSVIDEKEGPLDKDVLERLQEFSQGAEMRFPSFVDANRKLDSLNPSGEIPFILLIDCKGGVRFYQGSAHMDVLLLDRLVRQLLQEKISPDESPAPSDEG
jgi:hypothetical protein